MALQTGDGVNRLKRHPEGKAKVKKNGFSGFPSTGRLFP
jgi:hypothetical protein